MFHAVIQQEWNPLTLSPHSHASKVLSLLTRPRQDENDVNAKYSTEKHARCGEWQLCTGRIFSHECYGSRGIIIITAWSRCGQIRGFHCLLLTLSQKQRCWELQSSCGTFWDFVSLSRQGHGVWKNVPTTFCQSSQQTQRRRSIIQPHRSTYNSQGPVFFCIYLFYFKVSFLLSWNRVAFTRLGFTAGARTWQPDHPSQTGQQQKFRQSRAVIRLSRWLTGENKRQMKAVTSLSGFHWV